jgi:pyrimidine operon attenuation protein/uracil phosphoribosyltransferase
VKSQGVPGRSGPEDSPGSSKSPRDAEPQHPDAASAVLDEVGIRRSLMRIAHEIVERTDEPERLYLVAIPNGGVPLARRLATNLQQIADLDVPVGVLDTTLYRDDLMMTGKRPALRRTEMPSAVDDHVVVLVDDVVKTGRTIRAAMDALMDFGRPNVVQVVGLVDRGHRELPIKLDYVGKNLPTRPSEEVHLRGVDGGLDGSLELIVVSTSEAPEDLEARGEEG